MAALPFARDRDRTRGDRPFGAGGDRPRTAFVLSGGGNQAVAQVGMLRAIVERGIVPDIVIGTSAGAINGAAIAADPTPRGVERLAEVWRGLHGSEIFRGNRLSRAWNILSRADHLFSADGLEAIIDHLPAERFEELAVPLRIVATDLDTGEEVIFAAGALRPAILGSSALPGVFPPVRHGSRTLIDGGVVNNVPIRHALLGPAERIFVLNVTGAVADAPIRYPLDVTLRAFAIARNRRYQVERQLAPAEVAVVELPRPDDGRSIFDFTGSDIIMDEAHTLAAHHLDGLFEALDTVAADGDRRRWYHRFWPGASEQPEVPEGVPAEAL